MRHSCRPRLAAFAALALLAALASPLRAGTALEMSEAELVQRADWIGLGAVRQSRVEWRERRLWTFVELSVSETLKGAAGESMTVVVPGGIDPARGLAYRVPGAPAVFPRGAQLMVFGQSSPLLEGAMKPVGLLQGVVFLDSAAGAANGAALRERVRALLGAQTGSPAAEEVR